MWFNKKRLSIHLICKKAWHQPKNHMSQLLCSSATGRVHRTPNLSMLRWFGMQGSSKNYSDVDNFIVCSYSRMIVYVIDHRYCRPPKLIHTDTQNKTKNPGRLVNSSLRPFIEFSGCEISVWLNNLHNQPYKHLWYNIFIHIFKRKIRIQIHHHCGKPSPSKLFPNPISAGKLGLQDWSWMTKLYLRERSMRSKNSSERSEVRGVNALLWWVRLSVHVDIP